MIETDRLILSPYTPADAPAIVRNVNRPEVARMLESVSLPFTEADALARIEVRQCDETRFTFAIRERATGDVIGEIAAAGTDGGTPRLGYHIRPESWGRGYASEAVGAALDHAFGALGWSQIEADSFDDNTASVRILERAGFIRIGASTCGSPAREDDMTSSIFRLTRVHWAVPVLKTARLTLRPFKVEDAPRMHELMNDFEVSRMLSPVPYPYTRALAEAWVRGEEWKPDDIHFALDDGSGAVGGASLSRAEEGFMQTGFWLGQAFWGRGLMSEAVAAMIGWAFAEREETRLVSYAFVDNAASRRVHRKMGFTEAGTVRQHSAARGEEVDTIHYELTREMWQAQA